MDSSLIKAELIRLIQISEETGWNTARIMLDFPPYSNRSFTTTQLVMNEAGKYIRLIRPDEAFNQMLTQFIFQNNQDGKYNQIIFEAVKGDLANATLRIHLSQEVDQVFRDAVGKKYKGIPWWKNPAETEGLN